MEARGEAQEALMKEITRQVSALTGKTGHVGVLASVVRDFALAYRYASGGPQPGSVTVEK